MKELSCQFGDGDRLAGIVTRPDGPARRAALVLVSAGLSPKSGPFRLYAELARRLSRDGFLTLRFDLGAINSLASPILVLVLALPLLRPLRAPEPEDISSNELSRLAAVQFFKTANPQDEFLLINFNDRAQLANSFTASVEELQSHLMFTAAKGETALLDGIYLGLSEMKGAHNAKKALLIISDGGDNHSRYSEEDIRKYAKEADVQLYAIGLFTPGGGPTTEEINGPGLLSDLTLLTGGRAFVVANLKDLPDIATKISMELRNQYVVGYRPGAHAHDGKWRKIKIKLRPPKGLPPLTVYAKNGYYAPGH